VIRLQPRGGARLGDLLRSLLTDYPQRTFLGMTLMATQAFCYNAIFFTYALVLTTFYKVPAEKIGWFLLPFAAGNFLGPLLLGTWFDTLGRKKMIAASYGLSGLLMAATAFLFARGALTAPGRRRCGASTSSSPRRAPAPPISPSANPSRWRCGPAPSRCSMPSARRWAASQGRCCSAP
jgi:MFS family permease